MKRRWLVGLLCAGGAVLAGAALVGLVRRGAVVIDEYTTVQRLPRMFPDYAGTVVPPNLAPLNFCLDEPAASYCVRISSTAGEAIEVAASSPKIVIPIKPWHALLGANAGQPLRIDVFAQGAEGAWRRFDTITNTIAREPIDGYLVYRLMRPLYNIYRNMDIRQRNLHNYDETIVLNNRTVGRGCVNCHSFVNGHTDAMILQLRPPAPVAMILARSGSVARVDTRTAFNASAAAYTAWHPSGKLAAFSVNKLTQFFHTAGENRDVFDAASDLIVYLVDANVVTTAPGISQPDRLETFPTWSPDGGHLYFCSAPQAPIERYSEVRYDLMRIPYEPATGTWGQAETVLSAQQTGLSIAEPRVSPDGRFLLFCMADYGSFPIYQRSCDLYCMDLATRRYRRLAINSERTDSWHSWSSNSRWIVFSSKRRDGLFTKPYFSYFDEKGVAHKPLLLPQKDPAFYDSFIKVYNLPELVRQPVAFRSRALARAIRSPGAARTAALDPNVQPHEAAQQAGADLAPPWKPD